MWSNARMDKNAPPMPSYREAFERIAADILNQAFNRLPRLYSVRWQDEETGWQAMQVVAQSEDEATSIVQPIAGEVHVKAYRCAL